MANWQRNGYGPSQRDVASIEKQSPAFGLPPRRHISPPPCFSYALWAPLCRVLLSINSKALSGLREASAMSHSLFASAGGCERRDRTWSRGPPFNHYPSLFAFFPPPFCPRSVRRSVLAWHPAVPPPIFK